MAELESNPNASPLEATPRSRAIFDENETEAVALDSGHGSYADADSELNLKGEAKLAAADDQAGPQSIAEYGLPCILVWIEAALIYHRGEAIILVMGITGVGKSSFINCLTDRDVKIGHGLEPCKL
jgi:ribosome biogenesis GTPase A